MNGMTLLTEDQVFSDSNLEIFKKYGTACNVTDFATILGGKYPSGRNAYWTRTLGSYNIYGDPIIVTVNNSGYGCNAHLRDGVSIRPVIPYTSLSFLQGNIVKDQYGIKIAEFGMFPRNVTSIKTSRKLEILYRFRLLKKTESVYTINYSKYMSDEQKFEYCSEYEYGDKRYIRIMSGEAGIDSYLSNGNKVIEGKAYWIEVEPVKWFIDEREKLLVAKECIMSGIEFDEGLYQRNFDNTTIKIYMDKYLSKEMHQNDKGIEMTRKTDKINELSLALTNIEQEIESKYLKDRNTINEARTYLENLSHQTNEVTEKQLFSIVKMLDDLGIIKDEFDDWHNTKKTENINEAANDHRYYLDILLKETFEEIAEEEISCEKNKIKKLHY